MPALNHAEAIGAAPLILRNIQDQGDRRQGVIGHVLQNEEDFQRAEWSRLRLDDELYGPMLGLSGGEVVPGGRPNAEPGAGSAGPGAA